MNLDTDLRVGGIFKCVVRNGETHEVVRETPEFNNMVLDTGISQMFIGEWISGISIGKGTDEPIPTQTNLTNYSSRTTSVAVSSIPYVASTSPYYWSATRVYRFGVGTLNGTYTEVGASWSTSSCWSRSLIKNSLGVAEGIQVNSDEYLDVYLEVRVYLNPSVQTISSVDGSGNVLAEHTVQVFPVMVVSNNRGATFAANKISGVNLGISNVDISEDIGTTVGDISGYAVQNTYGEKQVTMSLLLPGSLQNTSHLWVQINIRNLMATTFNTTMSSGGGLKMKITPPIVKTSDKTVLYSVTLSISRYTP